MTLPHIIIDAVFLNDNRAIMANKIVSWSTSARQPSDSPPAVLRSPISAGLSRGHPAIVPRVRGANPLCPPTMPRLNVRARSSPSNPRRVLCAPFKETTTKRYQNKNRYGVPRGCIRASKETGNADCKSSRDQRDRGKEERGVTRSSLAFSRLCF